MKKFFNTLSFLTLFNLTQSQLSQATFVRKSSFTQKYDAIQEEMEMKRPRGKSPESLCGKVLYWTKVRRKLFDKYGELLGHFSFSKPTQKLRKIHAELDSETGLSRKAALEMLIENNEKIALNFSERIIRGVYFSDVDDVEKAMEKAETFSKIIMQKGILLELCKNFVLLEFHIRIEVEKLLRALIKENYGGFVTSYLPQNLDRILNHFLRGLLDTRYHSLLTNYVSNCSGIIIECLRLKYQGNEAVDSLHKTIVSPEHIHSLLELIDKDSEFIHLCSFHRVLEHILKSWNFSKVYPVLAPKVYIEKIEAMNSEDLDKAQKAEERVLFHNQGIHDFNFFLEKFFEIVEKSSFPEISLGNLYSLLLMRSNYGLMMNFIAQPEYFEWIISLTGESSDKLLVEVQSILTIFLINPHKEEGILKILQERKKELIKFFAARFPMHSNENHVNEVSRCLKVLSELK